MNASFAPLVVKIGGQGLADIERLHPLLVNIAKTAQQRPVVLVHGGGHLVDAWFSRFDKPVQKSMGLRVTQPHDMPIVAGALAGALNTQLVALLNQLKAPALHAVGVSLADAHWCQLTQDTHRGAVGIPSLPITARTTTARTTTAQPTTPQPTTTEPTSSGAYLRCLLTGGYTPVISSIGMFNDGGLANVNADQAAAAVAALLQADLLLLTDVDAILDREGRVINRLNIQQGQQLIDEGTVQGGMRVKLAAALEAAQMSRRSTAVAAWYSSADLTAHFTGHATATQICIEANIETSNEPTATQ